MGCCVNWVPGAVEGALRPGAIPAARIATRPQGGGSVGVDADGRRGEPYREAERARSAIRQKAHTDPVVGCPHRSQSRRATSPSASRKEDLPVSR